MKHIHIVGFGIAGALIAYELMQRGIRVTFHDDPDSQSSSMVAAGMITPITGMRLKPTWHGPELTALARSIYDEISHSASMSVWRDWTLRRVFRNQQMSEWFHERNSRGEFDHYHVEHIPAGILDGVRYEHGGFTHGGVSTVDLRAVIKCMQVRVSQTRAIDDNADAVIWCTGYKVLQNELWSWLPIEPSKGEILDVEIPSLDIDHILTNGTWILPVIDGNGIRHHHYRIGATHDWDDHDPMPTAKAREYLLQQASMMISQPIIVTGHRAAIRPSTQFKRPIVGRHPIHSKNYVFSGLGTKGALQGPYAARQLADYMLHDKPLDDEINCARWWSRK